MKAVSFVLRATRITRIRIIIMTSVYGYRNVWANVICRFVCSRHIDCLCTSSRRCYKWYFCRYTSKVISYSTTLCRKVWKRECREGRRARLFSFANFSLIFVIFLFRKTVLRIYIYYEYIVVLLLWQRSLYLHGNLWCRLLCNRWHDDKTIHNSLKYLYSYVQKYLAK